jgi:hypothetical protein
MLRQQPATHETRNTLKLNNKNKKSPLGANIAFIRKECKKIFPYTAPPSCTSQSANGLDAELV